MTKFTLPVIQDPETQDFVIQLPPEFLAQQGWQEGDALRYTLLEDGGFSVVNTSKEERDAQDLPLFIVETVISYRIRYAVRAKTAEHANDAVTMEKAEEFDQNCLGEQIFSTREVTMDEFIKERPDYMTPQTLLRQIHAIDYKD